MADFIEAFALTLGLLFCLLAGVGIMRMPDIYTRMQASTKAGTLGIVCIIVAVGVHFGDAITALQATLIIAFLFLTAPIASHLIARSVYFYGKQGWDTSALDEMADMYIIESNAQRTDQPADPRPAPPRGDKPVEDEPGRDDPKGRTPA